VEQPLVESLRQNQQGRITAIALLGKLAAYNRAVKRCDFFKLNKVVFIGQLIVQRRHCLN
jgi:hypothetical protein